MPAPEDAAPDPAATRRNPVVPVLLGWLLPGAGHLVAGRPWPGIFVASAIWPLFAWGTILAGFGNVSWERHPWLFGVQALAALPTAATALLTKSVVLREYHQHHTVGDLFTCVAGLLNLVAVADVWARCVDGDPEARLARKLADQRALAEAERAAAAEVAAASAMGAAPAAGPAERSP